MMFQFGMAVLRGMGWRPDEGIGGFNKKAKAKTYLFTWCVVPHGPGRSSAGNVRSGMSDIIIMSI